MTQPTDDSFGQWVETEEGLIRMYDFMLHRYGGYTLESLFELPITTIKMLADNASENYDEMSELLDK